MAASLPKSRRQKRNHHRWLDILSISRDAGQNVTVWAFVGFRAALGWWYSGSNSIDNKILYARPTRLMFMLQVPLWGKIFGAPLSRKVKGKVEADWSRKCPMIKWTTDAYGLAKPEVTFDSAIPDEQGISINSTQDEISAAMQRGKPSIQ